MKVGILQTGAVPDVVLRDGHGTFSDMFEAALAPFGFTFHTFNVLDMDFPETPEDADAWLITGSRHGVYEDHDFIPPLESFIRAIHSADLPLVGVCFGHQIIAQALGGRVEKFDGGWVIGRTEYDWGGETLHLNAWHQDQVLTPPKGARILASTPACANAAMAIGDRIFTVQPHPEFSAELIELFLNERSKGIVPDDLRDAARRELPNDVDSAQVIAMMAQVLSGRPL